MSQSGFVLRVYRELSTGGHFGGFFHILNTTHFCRPLDSVVVFLIYQDIEKET